MQRLHLAQSVDEVLGETVGHGAEGAAVAPVVEVEHRDVRRIERPGGGDRWEAPPRPRPPPGGGDEHGGDAKQRSWPRAPRPVGCARLPGLRQRRAEFVGAPEAVGRGRGERPVQHLLQRDGHRGTPGLARAVRRPALFGPPRW